MPRSNKKKKSKPERQSTPDPVDIPFSVFEGAPSQMVQQAIASGARHGIQLLPGRVNQAVGDCAFEAPLFNVNDRKCFNETFPLSTDYYRRIWCADMENRLFESPLNPGYSFSDWHSGWNKMKESNVYEVDYFGDFIIPAVACGLKKIILIINANPQHMRTPISVINPSSFGVSPNSQTPVVLSYNISHYESLHPADEMDIAKSIELVQLFEEGNYTKTFRDLPTLVNLENIPKINKNGTNVFKEERNKERNEDRNEDRDEERNEERNEERDEGENEEKNKEKKNEKNKKNNKQKNELDEECIINNNSPEMTDLQKVSTERVTNTEEVKNDKRVKCDVEVNNDQEVNDDQEVKDTEQVNGAEEVNDGEEETNDKGVNDDDEDQLENEDEVNNEDKAKNKYEVKKEDEVKIQDEENEGLSTVPMIANAVDKWTYVKNGKKIKNNLSNFEPYENFNKFCVLDLLSKPVLRTNSGKTKKEKKSFSFREKNRITSLLEKQIIEPKLTNGKHQSKVKKC